MKQGEGRVYLVGAGCGQADLITVRGLSLLRGCDAVVYDDLIASGLLDQAPDQARRHYVGKRMGKHSVPQEEICKVLISLAREGKTVVRLKGGDPFVFGRGGEEMLALQAADIPCEEVPGVSSAIAIPAMAGIPVTHRELSRSFHVITAHTAGTPNGLPADFDTLAGLSGTLVFLMGLNQLPYIARQLVAAGKDNITPAAVISGGNAPHPVAVRGTLADIAEKAKDVRAPAVIVVGDTAAMDISSTLPKPLRGVQIGLTGTSAVTDKLSSALQSQGAEVFLAERSVVEELPFHFDLSALCGGNPCWVVFTSGNGVRIFFKHLSRQKIDLRRLNRCRFAVIGPATGEALARYGMQADLCPGAYTSEALGHQLLEEAEANEDIFLFRSGRGSAQLFHMLSKKFSVQDIPIYGLRADGRVTESGKDQLPAADYLTFSSASGVELFFDAYGAVPERAVCVCIGEVTAAALQKRYCKPFLTANDISCEGITEAILQSCRGKYMA